MREPSRLVREGAFFDGVDQGTVAATVCFFPVLVQPTVELGACSAGGPCVCVNG